MNGEHVLLSSWSNGLDVHRVGRVRWGEERSKMAKLGEEGVGRGQLLDQLCCAA